MNTLLKFFLIIFWSWPYKIIITPWTHFFFFLKEKKKKISLYTNIYGIFEIGKTRFHLKVIFFSFFSVSSSGLVFLLLINFFSL